MPNLKGPSVVRIAPFALYILFLVLDQPLSGWFGMLGVDVRWLYVLKVGLVAMLLAWLWHNYSELAWPPMMPRQAWLVSGLIGVCVFFLWVLPYPSWAKLGAGGAGFNPMQPDGAFSLLFAAIRLSGAGLVVPVMEELFWRSFIMRWLDRPDFLAADPMLVDRRAFFVTALLFAVEHHLWLAGLFAGIAFGWLYKQCRNLWAPVLAHGITNAMLGIWVLSRGAWQYW